MDLRTLEGGISADVIPAERREDHKFCNAVSGEGFLQESIDHYKSKQTAGVLFMYEEGIPVFFSVKMRTQILVCIKNLPCVKSVKIHPFDLFSSINNRQQSFFVL